MKRIVKPSMLYKAPQDIRRHSLGISKYIYLTILLFFIFAILNYIFYPVYLLNGDGFIVSEKEDIALEYDAKIKMIMVENGDRVESGQSLFLHDSLAYKSVFLKAARDYTDTMIKFQEYMMQLDKYKAQLSASQDYFKFIEENKSRMDQLYRGRITDIDRVLSGTTRVYETHKDMIGMKAEYGAILKSFDKLRQVMGISSRTLTDMVDDFNDGLVKTPVTGIVGGLYVSPGSVVKMGETIIELFYGKRRISVLFEESFVGYKLGDPVVVYIPGKSFALGRIVDIGAYSDRLPEEIKPKYRPPGRRKIATVLVDADLLKNHEIMSVVEIYKPRGLNAFCAVFGCNEELVDEWRDYVKEKREYQREVLSHYKPYRVKLGISELELNQQAQEIEEESKKLEEDESMKNKQDSASQDVNR